MNHSSNGAPSSSPLGPLGHMTGGFKPGTPDSCNRSTPGTSSLVGPQAGSPPHKLGYSSSKSSGNGSHLSFDGQAPSDDIINNGRSTPLSPQQSPAVSTPLPPPLSSPATPDTAVSLPPPSPSTVTHSPGGISTGHSHDTPPTSGSASSPPQHSPSIESPTRRSPSSQMMLGSYKGMQHPQGPSLPLINGTAAPNSNGPVLTFPQHLLQQQMMGGLMQATLPPNMPPPPNHTRMPPMPPAPFPGFMRPPTHHRIMGHEESPEALLFNKIVGGAQFPGMNQRPFFQQDAANQAQRNQNIMFHRDPALESIKSEPEPILN